MTPIQTRTIPRFCRSGADTWRPKTAWLYFINGDNSHYSPDGASSVVEAIQTFKQKSIRTVYNVKKSENELSTAWGLESRMEGTRWKEGDVRNSTSSSNGRLNTIRCILGENYVSNRSLHWTEVLNPSEHYGLTDDHQRPARCAVA